MNRLKALITQKSLFLLMITAISLMVGLSYVIAGEDTLFLDAPGPVMDQDAAVSQAKRVEINWSVLEDPKNKRITINLFDGNVMTAVKDHTVPSSTAEGFVWVGHVLGENNSAITLSVVDDVLVGSIILQGIEQYTVRYNGQWQELHKINPSKRIAVEGPDTLIPPAVPVQDLNKADLCEDGSRIDLLVAYTPAARDQEGGTAAIKALINQRVADMNTANANSGLAFNYRLVHVMETNYPETGDVGKDLDRLADNSDPYLADVITARDQHQADMTSLIISQATTANSCGVAYLMSGLSTGFANFALNVTALDYTDPYTCHTLTLAHEFGHNMGNHHDRTHAGSAPIFPYAYGYQSPERTFRTIMAYECSDGYCPRINLWSNPDVSYVGEPTGIDYETDPSNSADNVRSMEQTSYYVANFQQNCDASPTPTATSTSTATNTPTATSTSTATNTSTATSTSKPDALSAPVVVDIENPDYDGNYIVEWSSIASAESYEMQQKYNSAFWITAYEGSNRTLNRSNMPHGSYCYRVKALNLETDSEWSVDKCTEVRDTFPSATPTATKTPQLPHRINLPVILRHP